MTNTNLSTIYFEDVRDMERDGEFKNKVPYPTVVSLKDGYVFDDEQSVKWKRFVSGKSSYDIKYPAINPEWEKDNWYNIDVPKQQKRLNNAGIANTKTLIEAVEQYGKILDIVCKEQFKNNMNKSVR